MSGRERTAHGVPVGLGLGLGSGLGLGLGLGGLLGEVGPDPALLGKVEVAQVLALLQIVEHELGHLKDTIARGVWLGGQG